jgi:hypothetical protein
MAVAPKYVIFSAINGRVLSRHINFEAWTTLTEIVLEGVVQQNNV